MSAATESKTKIRIVIADDHTIVREGLKLLIAECPDMEVVGEASDGFEAVKCCRDHPGDLLLLDVSMPGPGFVRTLREIKAQNPDLKILVLSVHPEDHYAVRALRAGAAGYLTKDRTPAELAKAIRRVHKAGVFVTESLAEKLALNLDREKEAFAHEDLSNREFQILCQLGSGKSVTEIGDELGLSPKTVSAHRARVMEKMNFKNNSELIRYAIENDLIA